MTKRGAPTGSDWGSGSNTRRGKDYIEHGQEISSWESPRGPPRPSRSASGRSSRVRAMAASPSAAWPTISTSWSRPRTILNGRRVLGSSFREQHAHHDGSYPLYHLPLLALSSLLIYSFCDERPCEFPGKFERLFSFTGINQRAVRPIRQEGAMTGLTGQRSGR